MAVVTPLGGACQDSTADGGPGLTEAALESVALEARERNKELLNAIMAQTKPADPADH